MSSTPRSSVSARAAARSRAASVRGVERRDCNGVGVSGRPGNRAGSHHRRRPAPQPLKAPRRILDGVNRSVKCCQTCLRRRMLPEAVAETCGSRAPLLAPRSARTRSGSAGPSTQSGPRSRGPPWGSRPHSRRPRGTEKCARGLQQYEKACTGTPHQAPLEGHVLSAGRATVAAERDGPDAAHPIMRKNTLIKFPLRCYESICLLEQSSSHCSAGDDAQTDEASPRRRPE